LQFEQRATLKAGLWELLFFSPNFAPLSMEAPGQIVLDGIAVAQLGEPLAAMQCQKENPNTKEKL
jgi:hypothetical protein